LFKKNKIGNQKTNAEGGISENTKKKIVEFLMLTAEAERKL
jgi:hypothetical protein